MLKSQANCEKIAIMAHFYNTLLLYLALIANNLQLVQFYFWGL